MLQQERRIYLIKELLKEQQEKILDKVIGVTTNIQYSSSQRSI